MLIIITIGILLGAHVYIQIVELQEAQVSPIPVPVAKERGVIELIKPHRALVPT